MFAALVFFAVFGASRQPELLAGPEEYLELVSAVIEECWQQFQTLLEPWLFVSAVFASVPLLLDFEVSVDS